MNLSLAIAIYLAVGLLLYYLDERFSESQFNMDGTPWPFVLIVLWPLICLYCFAHGIVIAVRDLARRQRRSKS